MATVPDRPLEQAIVAECHDAYSKILERYAWAIVRDWSLAADVVQTSFAVLSRFGGDVAPEARKSWLFRVAHREALRIRDRQKPYMQTHADAKNYVFENRTAYEIHPLARLADREEVEQLTKQIGKLPQEQQDVLRLRFFEDKSFAEIAAAMQTPIGTALSRMRIALERLRSMADEKGIEGK